MSFDEHESCDKAYAELRIEMLRYKDALGKLMEACDASNDACYGTLSVSFVKTICCEAVLLPDDDLLSITDDDTGETEEKTVREWIETYGNGTGFLCCTCY